MASNGQAQTVDGLSSRLRVVIDMPLPVMNRLLAVPVGTWVHLRNVKGHKHANGYMYCAARMNSLFEVLPLSDPRVDALLKYAAGHHDARAHVCVVCVSHPSIDDRGFDEKKRAFLAKEAEDVEPVKVEHTTTTITHTKAEASADTKHHVTAISGNQAPARPDIPLSPPTGTASLRIGLTCSGPRSQWRARTHISDGARP
jgi:hypothetical protein